MTFRKSLFYSATNDIRKDRPSFRKSRTLSPLDETPLPPNWASGVVARPPDIRLHDWSAIDAANFGKVQYPSTRHVIGNVESRDGFCLSSEICLFDPRTRRAMAKNGTVYELVGDATIGSLAAQKCHRWASDHLLHFINSTRTFVHALATDNPTVVYTIALATERDTLPVEIGRLSVTRDGAACDAVFEGKACADESRTLRLSDSIREDEPICSLLVRLLEQVPVSDRVNAALPTDFFKLSVHIGATTLRALEIESLETAPNEYLGGNLFKYSDMHDRETDVDFPGVAVSPVDFIVATFPSMWEHLSSSIDWEREESERLATARPHIQRRPAVAGEYWDDMEDDPPF